MSALRTLARSNTVCESAPGKAPDAAEIGPIGKLVITGQRHLNGNRPWTWAWELRGKHRSSVRAAEPRIAARRPTPPSVTAKQTNFRGVAGSDLLKIPFWKLHRYETVRAVRKIAK